ncbi:MAG: nucleotidyltransferase domain-containing protein [Parcubacteria group bacterium]|nr:nucleotidyltransferase domain-containing protein [Parcubacteria group bacterium]
MQQDLKGIINTIVTHVAPEKVIMFGSYAWGTPSRDSDLDLFVIKKTDRSTREVAREIDGLLWGRTTPIDIIVYTPEQVAGRLKQGDFFIHEVLNKGKVLYAREE